MAPEQTIALLGGSFNPPHVAHQMLCLWALSSQQVDQVWFIPCYQHAFGKDLEDFEDRRMMCELAAKDFPTGRVAVSDVERQLGGESRTYHTIKHLQQQHPDASFKLLIGADILQEKHKWYRFADVEKMAGLLVAGRSGYPESGDTFSLPAVSSTDIRQRLAEGRPVDHLLPWRVLTYLRSKSLFGTIGASDTVDE
jgi:nicotinate-nucleotide adenylyltransferase